MINTGERLIPKDDREKLMYGEHIIRYELSKKLMKNKVVLDIASGTGYGTQVLSTVAKKVYGVDISKEAIDYAKKHYSSQNLSFLQGSADKIPFDDEVFEVVNSFETIEHIPTYKEFIKEAKRVLKKNGVFIVSTPNKKEFIQNAHYHVHEFFEKEFTDLLKRSFKNVEIYYQDTFKGSSVHSASAFGKTWQKEELVLKSITQAKEKAIYFIAICSDDTLPVLDEATIIAEQWSDKKYFEKEGYISSIEKENVKKQKEIDNLNRQVEEIISSRSWQVTKPIRNIKKIIKNNK